MRDHYRDLSVGIDMVKTRNGMKVLGKERAKAITTYTKLKLYDIAICETTHKNLLSFLHDDIHAL